MQYNKDAVQFYILVGSNYLQEKLKSYGDSKVKVYSDVSSIVNTAIYACLLLNMKYLKETTLTKV